MIFSHLILAPILAASGLAVPAAPSAHADAYYLYCLFQQSLIQRDYGRALSYLEQASRSDPNAPQLATELGRAYLNMDELDRAEAEARRAAALDPSSIEARRLLADIYRQYLSHADDVSDTLFTQATVAYADLIAADPTDSETRLDLSRLYMGRGLFGQAAEILKAQLVADPDSMEAAYLLGACLVRGGNPLEARDVLQEAVRRHPENADLQRGLAEAMESAGDLEGARALLSQAVMTSPDRPGLRFQLARLCLRMKKYDEASAQAEILIRALSGSSAAGEQEVEMRSAQMLLIESYGAAGKYDQAIAAASRAERDFPRELRFLFKRGELLLEAGRVKEAEAVFASIRPGSVSDAAIRAGTSEAYFRAGTVEERNGNVKRAEEFLRRAIDADGENHAAMNYLGYLMADRGDNLDESLDLIQRALRLDEGNGAYLDSLGWTLFRLQKFALAEEPLKEATKAMPEEPVVHDHLGDLYWALGRRDEAVHAWQEALRLGSADAAAIRKKISRAAPPSPPGS